MKLELTTKHESSDGDRPVFILDGKVVPDDEGLHALCEQFGWTQPEFAHKAGINISTAKKWLSANRKYVAPLYALRLASYFLRFERKKSQKCPKNE